MIHPLQILDSDVARVAHLLDLEEVRNKTGDLLPVSWRHTERPESFHRLVLDDTGQPVLTEFLEIAPGIRFTIGDQILEIFDERDRQAIRWIVENLELPDPVTIDQADPRRFTDLCDRIRSLISIYNLDDQFDYRFLDAFQIGDIAKAVIAERAVLSWCQGLGKTIGALLYAKAAGVKRALFIVPQDLIPQWQRTAERFFMTDLRPIRTLADALRIRELLRAGHTGYYSVHYEALSQSGKRLDFLPVQWELEGKDPIPFHPSSLVTQHSSLSLESCPVCGMTTSPAYQPVGYIMRDLIAKHGRSTSEAITAQRGIWRRSPRRARVRWNLQFTSRPSPRLLKAVCTRCGYNHLALRIKPAYYPLRDLFDLIVVDEGTRIKNLDSQIGQAIQAMRARRRLLLTGTPIKNYLPDIFPLLLWALGAGSARFPFERDQQSDFERRFSVVQYRINDRGHRTHRKVIPGVSNIVEFWSLASRSCIRRTMANAGVPTVPLRYHDLRAPFGTLQAHHYTYWLTQFVPWFCARYAELPISAYPELVKRDQAILGQYAKLQFACTLPGAEKHSGRDYGPDANYIPKNLAVIRKACELADQGRRLVIFSAIRAFPLWAANILNRLGYPALSVVRPNGTTAPPAQRARIVRDFTQGGFPILCATLQSMNLGHNLECASALILNGLVFDHATIDQAIKRVHRITSRDPVDVYIALACCTDDTEHMDAGASLDQKIRQLLREKANSASIALDGALPDTEEHSVDLRKLLKEVQESWKQPINTLNESDLRGTLQNIDDLLAIAA